MKIRNLLPCAVACAFLIGAGLALTPSPARADVSVEGGATVTGSSAHGAGALSLGLMNTPLVPLSFDLTGLVATGGGYAATLDARFAFAGTAVGAGAGIGSLNASNRTGTIYNGLLAHDIAPHTAVEARLYFGPSRPSTLFAGLRFSL